MINRNRAYVAVLVLLSSLVYWRTPLLMFQQDEWHHLAQECLWHQKGLVQFFLQDVVGTFEIRFLPMANLVNYIQYSLFKGSPMGYLVVSLCVHIINVCLFYALSKVILKSRGWAFFSALIFLSSPVYTQAVTWPIQHTTTLPALTFMLISIFLFINKRVFLSLFMAVIATFFKETAFFLFPFFVIYSMIYLNDKKEMVERTLYILIGMSIYFFLLVFRWQLISPGGINLPGISDSPPALLSRRLSVMPVQTIVQSFVTEDAILSFSRILATLVAPGVAPQVNVYSQIGAVYFLGLVILLLALLLVRQSSDRKLVLLSFSLLILSSLPLLFVSGPSNFTLLPERYLYIPAVGSSLLLVVFARRFFMINRYLGIGFLCSVVLLGTHTIYSKIENQYQISELRKNIISQIESDVSELPEKVVFYTESDTAYYGLPDSDRIMPFQSGFGQTLIVVFNLKYSLPNSFLSGEFLWDIQSQGYKQSEGRGFGYFRDFDLMANTLDQNDIDRLSVIAYRYDSDQQLLINITSEVQGRLEGREVTKERLDFLEYRLTSTINNLEIDMAKDGKRETKWDSQLPYIYPQMISVDLLRSRKIAQIRIDSYDNYNQDKVGYRVSISNDGTNWEEVFFAKVMPPDPQGHNDIYFRPSVARYVRIDQVGSHRYATWVIHELSIFEVL